ncbi:MAG: hypothetical protein Q8O84_01900 [Nanoarchaeota archaeon]|nr:hypothetical protein [Nanoarchaeota archaeon]
MLEKIIEERKAEIDREAEIQKKKIDFIANQFNENKEVLSKHIKKYNISTERAYNELKIIINNLHTSLHIETKDGYKKIKDIQNNIYIKLGYYTILNVNELDPEMNFEQCTLISTDKGIKTYKKYIQIK